MTDAAELPRLSIPRSRRKGMAGARRHLIGKRLIQGLCTADR
jgi:hypothetical protein